MLHRGECICNLIRCLLHDSITLQANLIKGVRMHANATQPSSWYALRYKCSARLLQSAIQIFILQTTAHSLSWPYARLSYKNAYCLLLGPVIAGSSRIAGAVAPPKHAQPAAWLNSLLLATLRLVITVLRAILQTQ